MFNVQQKYKKPKTQLNYLPSQNTLVPHRKSAGFYNCFMYALRHILLKSFIRRIQIGKLLVSFSKTLRCLIPDTEDIDKLQRATRYVHAHNIIQRQL